MVSNGIIVKTESDIDFVTNYLSEEYTQNSQNMERTLFSSFQQQQQIPIISAAATLNSMNLKSTTQQIMEDDDAKLKALLKEFNLEILYNTLKYHEVTFRRLQYLHEADLRDMFPLVGLRSEFREKLFAWRKRGIPRKPTLSSAPTLPSEEAVTEPVCAMSLLKEFTTPPATTGIDVKAILKQSSIGEVILARYAKSNDLNARDRSDIVKIVVDYWLLKKYEMTTKIMSNLGKAIVECFPTEIVTTYFIERDGRKNPQGKLYTRYFNEKSRQRRRQKEPTTSKHQRTASHSELGLESESEAESAQDSRHDSDMDVSEDFDSALDGDDEQIKRQWRSTFHSRMKQRKLCLENYLQSWPHYKKPNGFIFFDIDFNAIHPGKENNFFEKIDTLIAVIKKRFFPLSMTCKTSQIYYERFLNDANNKDTMHYYFFCLLHCIMLPSRISQNKKPSITEAQNDMIQFEEDIKNFEYYIYTQVKEEEYVSVHASNTTAEQEPRFQVIVVGENVMKLKEFYVYFNRTLYKQPSLLHCIDLLVKISIVLKVDYSMKSKQVWAFLQEYIFEIPSELKTPRVNCVLHELKNAK